jgi:hypothetical protein
MSNRTTNSPVTQTKGQKSKTSPPSQLYNSTLHEPSFTKEMYNQIGEKNLMELSEPQSFRDGRKYTKILDGVHLDPQTKKELEDELVKKQSLLEVFSEEVVERNLDVIELKKENAKWMVKCDEINAIWMKKCDEINAKWIMKCDEMIEENKKQTKEVGELKKEVGELKKEIIELKTQNKAFMEIIENNLRDIKEK